MSIKLIGAGGGGRGRFSLFLFLIEENSSYQAPFRNEKILFLAKVIEFSNRENTYNYTVCAIPRKLT